MSDHPDNVSKAGCVALAFFGLALRNLFKLK